MDWQGPFLQPSINLFIWFHFFGSSVSGLLCTSNGLKIFTVPVKGRCVFFGSRHESEQVPPHPNSKVLV